VAGATIRVIDSIAEVQDELKNASENVLFVFDIDETLIAPSNDIFYIRFRDINDFDISVIDFVNQLRSKLDVINHKTKDTYFLEKITSAAFAASTFEPIEETTVEMIHYLQKKMVRVIALTSSSSGRCFHVENMKEWRHANLSEIGLDFSESFDIQEIEFDDMPPAYGSYPVFYRGILCAASNPKGKILATFLKKIEWKPSRIIFFDDDYENCKSVDSEMETLGLSIQCYCYRAAFKKKIKLDTANTQYHIDTLINNELAISSQRSGPCID
jgi:FMN phosphatase YigB (HAD superfamily)